LGTGLTGFRDVNSVLGAPHRTDVPVQQFPGGLCLRCEAAELAEEEGHHPNIRFGWGYVTASLQTKKIKGLHENDFIMAAKLDRIAAG
jgi:4a-hydroxytetrahydrobiopterin dehydratase